MLRVGPQSAGADPGPACYGAGGTEATVTDANLVLGRIDPDNFLGGGCGSTSTAARRAVGARRRGARAGRPRTPRMAIVRIANNNMIGALRSVLIERGLDPRDFTLCAFGGAGPLHASELIADMGIPRAHRAEPPRPVLGLRLHHDQCPRRPAAHDAAHLAALRPGARRRDDGDAGARGRRRAGGAGLYATSIEVHRALEMRYLGQNYELELPVGPETLAAGNERAAVAAPSTRRTRPASGSACRARSSRSSTTRPPWSRARPSPSCRELAAGTGDAEAGGAPDGRLSPAGRTRCRCSGATRCAPAHRIAGPALVEEAASVTVSTRASA